MNTAATILRILYGLLWFWAGAAKFMDPTAFSLAIRNFRLVEDPWVAALALFLPPLEMVAALAVIFHRGARGGLAILWIALFVFTLAIGISWARGLDIECGCFGLSGSTINYPIKLAQNLALLAVGGWLFFRTARPPKMEVGRWGKIKS
ncbi:MAG: hypothetical protein KDN19_07365 [Verrucomicrobiae bacterium]|nr:hypothetical protein [Verrucomicrobiae bacterium]